MGLREWSRAGWRIWAHRARAVALVLGLAGAITTLLVQLHKHHPIQNWLFWIYAKCWLFALGLTLACLSSGFLFTRLIAPRDLPVAERLYLSLPAGLFVFFCSMFVCGLLGLFGPWLGVCLPLLLIASGAYPLYREFLRVRKHFASARSRRAPLGATGALVAGLGVLALAMVYFNILTPENIAYDARWYHLPIA